MLRVRSVLPVLLLCAAAPRVAYAGPPLLVHPFDIGSAPSLPWTAPQGQRGYDRTRLIDDTEAILAANQSVLVHMETLRRAALYARPDRALLASLLSRLTKRAEAFERQGAKDPLAYLDAAYFTEALHQMDVLNGMDFPAAPSVADLTASIDGYPWIAKAIALRSHDPWLHFAAALIADERHRPLVRDHAQRARLGAANDRTLAANLDHVVH
jgi:hypothetical protein